MAKTEITLDEMMQVADLSMKLPGFYLYLEQGDVMRLVGEIRERTLRAHSNGHKQGWAEHESSVAKVDTRDAEPAQPPPLTQEERAANGARFDAAVRRCITGKTEPVREELHSPPLDIHTRVAGLEKWKRTAVGNGGLLTDLQERLLKAEETLLALENNGHERQIRLLQSRALDLEQAEEKAPGRLDAHHKRITALESAVADLKRDDDLNGPR